MAAVRSNRTSTPFGPNAITLLSHSVSPSINPATGGPTLVVRWTTGAEIDTYGFRLLRSSDGSRDGATPVSPLILRAGQGQGGASYEWVDGDAQPGVTYTYWLQEIELSEATNEYALGSGRISAQWRLRQVFLPMAQSGQ